VNLSEAIRLRNAALRELERADAVDKGSRWITHRDEMRALSARFGELDALVEELGRFGGFFESPGCTP
jgi:hypothetical protein